MVVGILDPPPIKSQRSPCTARGLHTESRLATRGVAQRVSYFDGSCVVAQKVSAQGVQDIVASTRGTPQLELYHLGRSTTAHTDRKSNCLAKLPHQHRHAHDLNLNRWLRRPRDQHTFSDQPWELALIRRGLYTKGEQTRPGLNTFPSNRIARRSTTYPASLRPKL